MTTHYNGSDYQPELDFKRLETQHERVKRGAIVLGWFTMAELSAYTSAPPGSVERQVRYLRAERFGGYTVEKRRTGDPERGLFEYRVSR